MPSPAPLRLLQVRDVVRDAERADDAAVLVAQRHLGGQGPAVDPAGFLQIQDRPAGADDFLFMRVLDPRLLLGKEVEVGLAYLFGRIVQFQLDRVRLVCRVMRLSSP